MDGRVALVTGGARGIGLAVCGLLAAEGMTVLLTARDRTRAAEAAAALSAGRRDGAHRPDRRESAPMPRVPRDSALGW